MHMDGIKISKTRMTTFIKTKFIISDEQTNIYKYRLAANITEYHIMYIKINLTANHYYKYFDDKAIISCYKFSAERKIG